MTDDAFMAFGRHVTVDISEAAPDVLDDGERLLTALVRAAEDEGVTVLGTLKHQFRPTGVTVLLLLAESHVSLHTYPGQGRAFFDAFTCGMGHQPLNIFRAFAERTLPGRYKVVQQERGWVEQPEAAHA
jgi:S-adenosylmethionine decarboxylase